MDIDLNAVFIPEDQSLWAFHAGKNKRHLKRTIESSSVFLDLPGFPFTRNVLNDDELIGKNIQVSEAIVDHYRTDPDGLFPSTNQNDYRYDPTDKSLVNRAGNIRRFYSGMKKGDMVVVPPRRQYDPIHFGILENNFRAKDKLTIDPYGRQKFHFRKVRWLDNVVSKRDLPPELSIKLENPHAITKISEDSLKEAIYAVAYPNFIYDGKSKVDVNCPNYRGRNPLETVEVQQLIALFTAVYSASENELLSELEERDLYQIAGSYYDDEFIADLSQQFSSPGYYRLIGGTIVVSLFVAAGVALATGGAFDVNALQNLTISNSADPADVAGVNDKIKTLFDSTLNSISPEVVLEINDLGQKARESLNPNTGVKIR